MESDKKARGGTRKGSGAKPRYYEPTKTINRSIEHNTYTRNGRRNNWNNR